VQLVRDLLLLELGKEAGVKKFLRTPNLLALAAGVEAPPAGHEVHGGRSPCGDGLGEGQDVDEVHLIPFPATISAIFSACPSILTFLQLDGLLLGLPYLLCMLPAAMRGGGGGWQEETSGGACI